MQVDTDEQKINEMLTRGVENLVPRELAFKKLRSGEQLRIYLGIDPTGAKLHLGHSVPLRKLRAFSDLGHHAIFLVGSFTATVGDPTGRTTAREPLSRRQIGRNFADYQKQASKILDFSKVEIRYNHEWLEKMDVTEFARIANHFSIQQIMRRGMFRERMKRDEDISPNEFFYPLMQGYDSVMLDVDCEIGGNDQLFNMLAGRKLHKVFHKRDKFILATRLIEGLDGRKMSKTYDNCVYLEDSPGDMYSKLMSLNDELMQMYFETCTDMPLEEVAETISGHPKDAKMLLAREIVTMYHNKEAARKAEENWNAAFSEGGVPEGIPLVKIKNGTSYLEALSRGLHESNNELRRLAKAGAITIQIAMPPDEEEPTVTDLNKVVETPVTLRIGKRRFLEIEFE